MRLATSPAQIPRLRLRRLSISVTSGGFFSPFPFFELASYCGWTADLEHLQIASEEPEWGLGLVGNFRYMEGKYRKPEFPSLRHLELHRLKQQPGRVGESIFEPLLQLPTLRSVRVAVPGMSLLDDAATSLLSTLTHLHRLVRMSCAAEQAGVDVVAIGS
jgi:hypothetical protein